MAASPRTSRNPPLFRAPPPSPAAKTSPEPSKDDEFSRFLRRSRRIPELILPHRNPPDINLESLITQQRGGSDSEEENLRSAARSTGCFQIVNHGIDESLMKEAVEEAKGIFGMSLEWKKAAERSPERMSGFEAVEDGDSDEFFWWSGGGAPANQHDVFSGKMEQLLMKIQKIAGKIELVLMDFSEQHSICDSYKSREEVNNMFVCLRKHKWREEKAAFDPNQEILREFIRGIGSSHALSVHVFIGASKLRVYSKQGLISFRPTDGAIVVTVGDQMQEKSGGIYKQAIGKPEYQWQEAQHEPISIAFLHSYTSPPQGNAGKEEKIISISKQLIMAAWLLLFYHTISYFCF